MGSAVTIHDVARAAGVSPTTVSRALSHPHLVAAATVARVRASSTELGYVPSPQARWLHTGRSDTLTLVLPDITNPFFFDLIRGAQHEAARSGLTQVLADTEEDPATERARLAVARKSTDGAILAATRLPDAELVALAREFAVVTVNHQVAGVPSVLIDTPPALADAVRHLAGLGHDTIAYLGGPASSWYEPRRWRAVRDTARALGLTCQRLGSVDPTLRGGRDLAETVAAGPATAVLCFNDLQALGLLTGLRALGIAVPDDLSVVGCDDIFGAELTTPALTTVTASAETAGRLATRALIARLATARSTSAAIDHVVPAALRLRGSTGPRPRTRRGDRA